MESNTKDIRDIRLLATYGTLRDDDDSGAAWTNEFVKDISGAITGRLVGYRLLGHPNVRYPFAIFTDDPKDSIVVRLLSWLTNEQFEQKITTADLIEGPDYERKVVEVRVEDGARLAYIYVSKASALAESWKVIPSGDWLKRSAK